MCTCREIQKYIQCSRELISKGCEGADAGNWYVSFLKSVLKYMTDNKQLKCSFGKKIELFFIYCLLQLMYFVKASSVLFIPDLLCNLEAT